jgi:tetratricopeptide (TPR) repeat protein
VAGADAWGSPGGRAGAGERIFVAALLGVFATLAILSMRVKNPTFDETAHLAAGVSYVQKADYRMNPEHPALPKLLAGAAATLAGARHSWDTEAWRDAEQWDFAREVLYGPGADWRRIVFAGRLPMVAIGALLGFATWAWTRAMSGPAGAAVALALYAFCPSFLAHARLVTTDVPLALAVVGASACLWAAWRTGRIAWTLAAAACVGVSMVTKFSAFSYAPAWILLALLPSAARTWRRSLAHAGVFAVAAFVATEILVSACYGFAFDWTTIRSLGMEGRGVAPEGMSLLRRVPYEIMARVPWPSPAFAAGMKDIILYTEAGHPVYLLGMRGERGWWWGPFATLAVKTSLPFLLLVTAAVVTLARSRLLRRRDLVFLCAAPAVVLATNVAANLGLGARHLIPTFPFLMALAGWSLRGGGFRGGAYSLALVVAMLVWHAGGTLAAHPHYLPFFNEIARVTGGGARWLGDSNLDWGQDLSAAAERLRARGATGAILCYFGTASPFAEDLEWQILPPAARGKARDPWTVLPAEGPQWLAVSVTNLQGIYYRASGQEAPMPWLDGVEPVETVGGTIRLYEISQNAVVQRGLAEIYRRHGLAEEAKRALIRAVREEPYDVPTRRALVAAWLAEGGKKEAEAVILATRNPSVEEVLELANIRKELGDPDGVMHAYESGLRGFEYEADIRNEYAWWLQETGGDLDRALELARRAVEIAPSEPYYLDTLAMVRLRRHELAEALEAVERALALAGGDVAAIRWHRALVLAEHGRGGEAVAEAEEILERDDLSAELEEEVGRWLVEEGR